jgi:hypothetical protein
MAEPEKKIRKAEENPSSARSSIIEKSEGAKEKTITKSAQEENEKSERVIPVWEGETQTNRTTLSDINIEEIKDNQQTDSQFIGSQERFLEETPPKQEGEESISGVKDLLKAGGSYVKETILGIGEDVEERFES